MNEDIDPNSDSPEEVEGVEVTRETPPAQKPEPAEPGKAENSPAEQLKQVDANLEETYPGITEQIRRFVEAEVPSCPYCESMDTASVQVGMTGRARVIAEATTKVKLVPSAKDKLGTYYCNHCGKYFN
ncbi:MAG TPA: hypothetical protein VJ821_10820 [Anaerolineales bacterium]|nr:hypothetical protein [Anaerolineales bacterium]